jgi:hypothetical protein
MDCRRTPEMAAAGGAQLLRCPLLIGFRFGKPAFMLDHHWWKGA